MKWDIKYKYLIYLFVIVQEPGDATQRHRSRPYRRRMSHRNPPRRISVVEDPAWRSWRTFCGNGAAVALPQRANVEINCIVAKHWPISRNLCRGPDRRPRMRAIWKDCARDAKAQSIAGLEARRRRNQGKIRRSANLRTILPGCGARKRLHRRNHLLRLFRLLIEVSWTNVP